MVKIKSEFRFIFFAGGIFVCYFIFGMLQEKITRGKYGEKDTFTCTLSLVLVQCVVNYIFAQILMLSWKHEKDTTRRVYYFSSALTYLLGMVASNLALQWINYPTQVVGKAAKPIPVLILGVLLGRKSYPLKKYLFVFVIVLGVALFIYKDSSKKVVASESAPFGIGEVLLLLSLTMDGLTGAVQERIKSESSPTAYSMMLNTNMWSSIMLAVGVLITGELFKFVGFVSLYPEVLLYLAALALMGALGQLFIFFMVSEFGPLPCSVVTTTRKFFTVLASVIIFGNVLILRQWFGAVLVFTGLFLDIFYSKGKSPPKKAGDKLIKDAGDVEALEDGLKMQNGASAESPLTVEAKADSEREDTPLKAAEMGSEPEFSNAREEMVSEPEFSSNAEEEIGSQSEFPCNAGGEMGSKPEFPRNGGEEMGLQSELRRDDTGEMGPETELSHNVDGADMGAQTELSQDVGGDQESQTEVSVTLSVED